jgi:signal peptidase II
MTYLKRLLLIGAIIVSCVGCDQATKGVATNNLSRSLPISYLGDTFRLQYIENSGGFLGIGSTLPVRLIVLTGLAIAGMLVFVLMNRGLRPLLVAGLSLIIGGGVGNLINRVFHGGAVIDFMNIEVGGLRTGIFNVADAAIMIGTGMIAFGGFRRSRLQYPS